MDDLEAQAIHQADQLGHSKWSAYAAVEAVDLVATLDLKLAGISLDRWTWRATFDKPHGGTVELALPEATRRMREALSYHASTETLNACNQALTRDLAELTLVSDPSVPYGIIELRDRGTVIERQRIPMVPEHYEIREEIVPYLLGLALGGNITTPRHWWQRLLRIHPKPKVYTHTAVDRSNEVRSISAWPPITREQLDAAAIPKYPEPVDLEHAAQIARARQLERDAAATGSAYVHDGERLDPHDVRPLPERCANGHRWSHPGLLLPEEGARCECGKLAWDTPREYSGDA